jgi:hypothetical protein
VPTTFPFNVQLREMGRFYSGFGRTFQKTPPGASVDAVALYCLPKQWAHVALRLPDYDDWWESKLGFDVRIVHKLKELEGANYGKVFGFYVKRRS